MARIVPTLVSIDHPSHLKDEPDVQQTAAARKIKDRLESAILPVAEHPYLYRPGRVPGTRELVAHPNYILVYLVAFERIEIVNVLHARQEYPLD